YLWILHSNRPDSKKFNFKEWFLDNYDQNVLKLSPLRKNESILPLSLPLPLSLNTFFDQFLHNLSSGNKHSSSKSQLTLPSIPFWNPSTLIDSRGAGWDLLELKQNLVEIPEGAIFSRESLPALPPKPSILKISKIFPEGPPLFTALEIYEHYYGRINEKLLGDLFERLMHAETKHTTGAFYTPLYICLKIGRDLLTDVLRPLFPSWDSNLQVADITNEITKTFSQLTDAQCKLLIPRIHHKLIELKILDPSLGAGHFLIAVDSLIIGIYRSIWEFLSLRKISGLIFLPANTHPNSGSNLKDISSWHEFAPVAQLLRLWYIYPHILYGVDINSRATRVAKWRLYCTLLDPNPKDISLEGCYQNLSFNIHVGNALLGINSWESVNNVLDPSSKVRKSSFLHHTENKLMELTKNLNYPLPSPIKQILELNSHEKFNRYSLIFNLVTLLRNVRLFLKQPKLPLTKTAFSENDKMEENRKFLEDLNRMIRNYLDAVYLKSNNLTIDDKSVVQKGLFHWIGEFPEIFTIPTPEYATFLSHASPNGFHLILGNPPYGNLLQPYEKSIFGNTLGILNEISSLFLERAMELTATRGSFGFLTSYTITFNKQLSRLRGQLLRKFGITRLATFDRDRCRMFENMTQSVSILQCSEKKTRSSNQPEILLSTQIYRELPPLDKLDYQKANSFLLGKSIGTSAFQTHRIPKIGIPAMTQFLKRMAKHYEKSQHQVGDLIKSPTIISSKTQSTAITGKYPDPFGGFWIRISGNYWYNAWNRPPYYGTQIAFLPLNSPDRNVHSFLLGLINSSLYYVWFRIYSDGRHMNSDILRGIPLPNPQQPSLQPRHHHSFSDTLAKFGNILEVYTAKLMEGLFDHFDSGRNRFRTSEIKALLDIGDHIFGIIFDLSPEDISFIQSFEPTIRGGCKITPVFSKELRELILLGDFNSPTSKDLLTFQSMMDHVI
ncbi:MAG: Eco57I restriction-modification methylase domain-containing protein, partial [Promethearchaeota archaeon]